MAHRFDGPEGSAFQTRRERLRSLLASRDDGYSLGELADILSLPRGVLIDDLRHLQMSVRHERARLLMAPATCRSCGFRCSAEQPRAPSRCPQCKGRALDAPVFKLEGANA
ncbi:MAG: transcriptional regulator [Thermoplasmatota archaeon]